MNESGASEVWGPRTRTSLILRAAGRVPDADAEQAWRDLIERYRAPVERCVRRQYRNDPASADAAGDFFAYLYEQRLLPKYERGKGRFRCYIQSIVRLYAQSWRRAHRSRGSEDVENLGLGAEESSPEFEAEEEVAWAEAILAQAVAKLKAERPRDVELLLRAYGIAPFEATSREDLRRETGMTANALNVAIHRAREALREIVLDEVRDLVSEERDFEEEKDWLMHRLFEAHPGMLGESA